MGTLQSVSILGVPSWPGGGKATVNGGPAVTAFNATTNVLLISFSGVNVWQALSVTWTSG
jgi:hypothetical protein